MKKLNVNWASLCSLILLLISLLTPLWPPLIKVNSEFVFRLINSFLIAFISYHLSFMETKKVAIFFLPLIFHSLIIVFTISYGQVGLNKNLLGNIAFVIGKLYDLISLVGIFFLMDFVLTRIFGSKLTNIFAFLSILIFFLFDYISFIKSFSSYRDIFLYFGVFVMAARFARGVSIKPYLYVLAIIVLLAELYVTYYFRISYDFLLAFFPLTYLLIKSIDLSKSYNLTNVLLASYLYIFPSILIITKALIVGNEIPILIIALLLTYILGQELYRLRSKYLNYLLIGFN